MAVPNANKEITKAKCQSIYMNLLALRKKDAQLVSTQWVREFEQTARCDPFVSFKQERQDYSDHAGVATIDRVLSYSARTEVDLERVDQAVVHNFDWHQKRLVSALTWSNYFKYQILHKHERLFSWLGLFTSAAGGWVFVRNRMKGIKTVSERAKRLNEMAKNCEEVSL